MTEEAACAGEGVPAPGGTAPQYLKALVPAELTLCNGAASFLQSGFWGSFKARFGWNARSFEADWGSWGVGPLLVIRRRLGPGISFAYVPWGPELPAGFPADDAARNGALVELARALRRFLPDAAFIRFDPPWFTGEASEAAAGSVTDTTSAAPAIYPPFVRAGADVQPPDTVLLDLTLPEEAFFGQMKSKWRYNARLAIKKGVIVRQAGEEGLETFYGLLKETAGRDGIAVHGIEYYRALFLHSREYLKGAEDHGNRPLINLYLAEHEGDTLAGIMTLFRGPQGVYLYGASSNIKRNLMAPYALQIKAMEDARAAGCLIYDLFGIPPRDDPSHPMAGLYRFKTGFGGRIIHRPGSWDYPYRPLVKTLFTAAESLRKSLRSLKKHRRRRTAEN